MPDPNKTMPFMKGKNGRFLFFQEGNKKLVDLKTWNIKANVTKHADGVNGEEADRLDKTFNFYELSAGVYMSDGEVLEAWSDQQAVEEANTARLDQQGAIRFFPRNGTKQSFLLLDMIWDDFDVSQGGRSETMMANVTMRFRTLKKAKAL